MAGHSQFKNIMHRKGAQDAKRAKIFTKIIREITVAVKTGAADPSHNPRLRAGLIAAREANMPKDRVDAAIKKASGAGDAENYEEIRYEGYGIAGVAVIVEALTDNRNRTAPEMRSIFTKYSGNLGESGSVSFMFDRVGKIVYPAKSASDDAMLEAAIEAGASDCISTSDYHEIITELDNLHSVRDVLAVKFSDPENTKLAWQPKTTTMLNEEQAQTLLKMIDALEDNDDVQNVWTNFEVSDEVLKKLGG